MRKSLGLTFTNLMDPGSGTIKRYGILNQEQGEIPHPAALVIDRQGVVRFVRVDEDYRKRPSGEELLNELRRLQAAKK
jgi:peroxiredoxin